MRFTTTILLVVLLHLSSVAAACDVNGDGQVDISDITSILAYRNQEVPPAPQVMDQDGDGIVTVNDARQCVIQCDNPRCSPGP